MFVDDNRSVPRQLCSCLSHGMGKREQLVARHEAGRADQKCGDFHVGIAIVCDVVDNCADLRSAQRAASDFGPHRIEAVGWGGRCDGDVTADRLGKTVEGRFGEAEFIGPDQPVVGSRRVASRTLELRRSSTRLKPRNTSGRSAMDRREITTTFSRPVSRLTRRIFSCGRDGLAAFILSGPWVKNFKQ